MSRAGARARLAHLVASTFDLNTIGAARDARIDLYPHQLEPALAVLAGHRRVLVADEVGLGKTVQAGLIVAELLRRSPTARALVVAPAGLLDQWADELSARFGVVTRAAGPADIESSNDMLAGAGDPWRAPGVWVGSVDYLKQPHIFATMPLVPWDLVVIDEAHGVAGRSDRHQAVDEVCRRARHVILLTATPHSGSGADFDRLATLGALGAPPDPLILFRRTRHTVALEIPRRVRWHRVPIRPSVAKLFRALTEFEQMAVTAAREAECGQAAALLCSVLWRRAASTIESLARSLGRRLACLEARSDRSLPDWLQPRLDFGDVDEDGGELERAALTADVGLRVDRERSALRTLARLAARTTNDDPKLARLGGLVRRARDPVVVFTEFRHSLEAAEAVLALRRPIAVLHGGLGPTERRVALGRFLAGEASVLLATDVGGQGLNLQSRARWVINLDVPWNPARLEQRIGRVDRIGQTRPVHATLLLLRHKADEDMRAALTRRADVAQRAVDPALFRSITGRPSQPAGAAGGVATTLPAETRSLSMNPMTSWVRPARALARVVSSKRALARCWRGPSGSINRPFAIIAASSAFVNRRRSTMLGYVVPLMDETGAVAEAHLVVIEASIRVSRGRLPRALAVRAELLARTHLVARRARVRRLAAERLARRVTTLHAVVAHLARLSEASETQLGLFAGRGGAAVITGTRDVARKEWRIGTEEAAEQAAAAITVGRPMLRWVWSD